MESADARATEQNAALIRALTDSNTINTQNAVINAQTLRVLDDMNRNIEKLRNRGREE